MLRLTDAEVIFDSKGYGSHYATRVRVAAPQGSCWDGATGVVARQDDAWGSTVMVRLDQKHGGLTLPFSTDELEVRS